jgi:prolyl-tRNA editing enzyme YbaK/EbsC (Cys-tRNA(Pro) deacylase)
VPPLAHANASTTLVDADLMRFVRVHAAGGMPNATFAIRPADLVAACGGRVADVRVEP